MIFVERSRVLVVRAYNQKKNYILEIRRKTEQKSVSKPLKKKFVETGEHSNLMLLIITTKDIIIVLPLYCTGSFSFSPITKIKIEYLITTARTDQITLSIFIIRVDGQNI